MVYGNDGSDTWSDVWCTYNGIIFSGKIGNAVNALKQGDVFTVPF